MSVYSSLCCLLYISDSLSIRRVPDTSWVRCDWWNSTHSITSVNHMHFCQIAIPQYCFFLNGYVLIVPGLLSLLFFFISGLAPLSLKRLYPCCVVTPYRASAVWAASWKPDAWNCNRWLPLAVPYLTKEREEGGGYTGVGGGTEVGTVGIVAPMYPGSEAVTGGLLLLSHISPTPDCYSCPNWLSRDSRVNIKAVISSCLTSLLTDNCKPSKGSGILMTTHKNFELWSSPLA